MRFAMARWQGHYLNSLDEKYFLLLRWSEHLINKDGQPYIIWDDCVLRIYYQKLTVEHHMENRFAINPEKNFIIS